MQSLQTSVREIRPYREVSPSVLIVDMHRLCRETIAAGVHRSNPAVRVRMAAPEMSSIVAALREEPSSLVLLSCCGDSVRPLTLLGGLRTRIPEARLVALADPKNASISTYARYVGVDTLLRSAADMPALVRGLVVDGRAELRAEVRPPRVRPLTARETEIAQLIAARLRNAEIAAQLGIAEKTVKVNLTNIYCKLGIRCRAQLAALAPQLLPTGRLPSAA